MISRRKFFGAAGMVMTGMLTSPSNVLNSNPKVTTELGKVKIVDVKTATLNLLPLGELILTAKPDLVRLTYRLHKELIFAIEKQDSKKAYTTALKATQRLIEIISGAMSV